jgi:hypothetical protein
LTGIIEKNQQKDILKRLLAKTNNNSILVFDDIHWSSEMEAAWETIKKDACSYLQHRSVFYWDSFF